MKTDHRQGHRGRVKTVHRQGHRSTGTEKAAGVRAAQGGEARTLQLRATLALTATQGQVGACIPPRPGPEAEPRNATSEASEMTIRQPHFTDGACSPERKPLKRRRLDRVRPPLLGHSPRTESATAHGSV